MSAAPRDICFVCGHEREGHDAYHARWGDRHAFVPASEVGTRATGAPRAEADELGRAAHEALKAGAAMSEEATQAYFAWLRDDDAFHEDKHDAFRAGWEARGRALGAGPALSDAEMRRAADEVWVEWSSQWASHDLLETSLWTLLQDAVRYGFAAGARRTVRRGQYHMRGVADPECDADAG